MAGWDAPIASGFARLHMNSCEERAGGVDASARRIPGPGAPGGAEIILDFTVKEK